MRLREMDERTTFIQQLRDDAGPIVLDQWFNVAPEDVERFEVWADDAAFMKQQPGFISTQLHRGTAGRCTFINVAVWKSSTALGKAFGSPEFQQRAAHYPDSAIAAPHVFEKVAVPGISWRRRGAQAKGRKPALPGGNRDRAKVATCGLRETR